MFTWSVGSATRRGVWMSPPVTRATIAAIGVDEAQYARHKYLKSWRESSSLFAQTCRSRYLTVIRDQRSQAIHILERFYIAATMTAIDWIRNPDE